MAIRPPGLLIPCALALLVPGILSGSPQDPPPVELQKLLGPWAPLGRPAEVPAAGALDEVLLKRGRELADQLPMKPAQDLNGDGAVDFADALFYDLPLTLYRTYYRTGDAYWRDKARASARMWRDYPGNQKMKKYLDGDWKLWRELVNQPRNLATIGLAVLALESNDAGAKQIVFDHATLIEKAWMYGPYQSLTDPVMALGDPRECGYSLIALISATILGEDHRKAATDLVDHILKSQKPDGQWLAHDDKIPGGGYTSNFMTGLLLESLIFHDRAFGDDRILPAVEKNLAWTWTTQWVAEKEGFQYHSVGETEAQPGLNGLLLPAWGYAYFKTGKPQYLEQGNRIAKGLAERGAKEIWGVKQYNQMFRSAPQYTGYVAQRAPSK